MSLGEKKTLLVDLEKLEDLANGELEIGAGVEAGAGKHDDVGT